MLRISVAIHNGQSCVGLANGEHNTRDREFGIQPVGIRAHAHVRAGIYLDAVFVRDQYSAKVSLSITSGLTSGISRLDSSLGTA